MESPIQEMTLLLRWLGGEKLQTAPNLLLLGQWGVLLYALAVTLRGWVGLAGLPEQKDQPEPDAALKFLHDQARSWLLRGHYCVLMILLPYVLWLFAFDAMFTGYAAFILGLWGVALLLLRSVIARTLSLTKITGKSHWRQQVRHFSMGLSIFVLYGVLAQHLSSGFIDVVRAAYLQGQS